MPVPSRINTSIRTEINTKYLNENVYLDLDWTARRKKNQPMKPRSKRSLPFFAQTLGLLQ